MKSNHRYYYFDTQKKKDRSGRWALLRFVLSMYHINNRRTERDTATVLLLPVNRYLFLDFKLLN